MDKKNYWHRNANAFAAFNITNTTGKLSLTENYCSSFSVYRIPSCCILQMTCSPEVLCQVWLTVRYKGGGILGSGLVLGDSLTEDVVWERVSVLQCPVTDTGLSQDLRHTALLLKHSPSTRTPSMESPSLYFQTTKWGEKSIPLHFSHLSKSPSPCWKWSWPSACEPSGPRRPLWATASFLRDRCFSSCRPCTATAGICSWIYSFSLLDLAFVLVSIRVNWAPKTNNKTPKVHLWCAIDCALVLWAAVEFSTKIHCPWVWSLRSHLTEVVQGNVFLFLLQWLHS